MGLVLIIALIILTFLLEKIINKLLRVEKKKISKTSGKNVDRWGRGIILLIYLVTLPFVIEEEIISFKWYIILYLTLLFSFQSILEWKYLKSSKQFITTLIILIYGVIIIHNIEYFM